MSGIFGILNLDGALIPRTDLETMRQAMNFWGPHGSAIWQGGNIGLGHLMLHNTPESLYDIQPLRHPSSGVTLSAHARIDNRDELIRDLRLEITTPISDIQSPSPNHQSPITDSQLILHAYLRWGEDCVRHLLGDWVFAIWDSYQRKLFLARDHFGISSLYYYQGAGFLAFASSIKALLALSQIPQRPNLLCIAQTLTIWPGDGTQTAYEGILQLPNAHTLAVKAGQIEARRYWNFDNAPTLRLGSDDAYAEAFLEIYTEAVRCRLRIPSSTGKGSGGESKGIGATLSSGLDSSSVCALAARELRQQGGSLHTYTSIPIYPTEGLAGKNRYGDEAPLVEIIRTFIPNLDVEYIRAEHFSPLDGIARALELHDGPATVAGNAFWLHALLEKAQHQGLGVLLTGQMGNGSVSWSGGSENYWPLLLTGRWSELRNKARDCTSLYRTIRSHFVRPLVQPFRDQVTRLRQMERYPWADYAAISSHFARSLHLVEQMQATGHDPFFIPPIDPSQAQLSLFRLASPMVGAPWAENGAAYGLEVRDPTMDKRLIEFCLAIPQEQYRLDGQDRSLVRRAMVGLLPDAVRINTRRGRQAADLGHRLLAELPRVQNLMAQLEASELACTVLDLPKMQAVLDALQVEVNRETTEQSMSILTRGLMTGMFLLKFA